MRSLLRIHLTCSLVFLLGGIVFLVVYRQVLPDPPLLFGNAEFVKNVKAISDIDHLRKVLYTVVIGTDRSVVAMKEVVDQAVYVLVFFCFLAAAAFGYCFFKFRQLVKKDTPSGDGGAL
jgi:hypothetical protein